jgi:glucokinase
MALVNALTIGVDIGGTKVAAGVVDPDGNVVEKIRRDTPGTSARATEDTIAEVVAELRTRYDVSAIGIGAAGWIDVTGASVLFSPHLAWRHEPLQEAVRRRVRLPVVVENDANAAAWAEWRFGAAQGETHLVCVTLGTGIGGAFVLDGDLQRGRFGIAGEYGHMTIVPDGRRCECGNRGCWEQYASGNALVREARELCEVRSPVAAELLRRAGGDAAGLTGPLVTQAAKDGDPLAIELLGEIGHWLGLGLANLASALDPGTFVVGGGVCEAGDLFLGPARNTFRHALAGRGFRPEARILKATLGPDAGMVGAADLARQNAGLFRRVRRRPRSASSVSARRV